MRKVLTATWLVLLVLLIGLGCSKTPKGPAQRLVPGDEAPVFNLPFIDSSEEVIVSKDFHRAYATVLIFWNMSCPSCREALVQCQQVYDDFRHTASVFYGVNFDTENLQGVRAFLKGENITIPHLWDRGQRATRDYKALDYTFSLFVIDREGEIVLAQYDHPPDLVDVLTEALEETLPPGAGD